MRKKHKLFVVLAAMSFCLAGCGEAAKSSDQPAATSETSSTENIEKNRIEPVTIDKITEAGGDVNSPDRPVASVVVISDPTEQTEEPATQPTEAPTTETPKTEEPTTEEQTETSNGGYHYSAYGVDITLPIDINDYYTVNDDGKPFFKYGKLAKDFGWVQLYDNDVDNNCYWYDIGDGFYVCLLCYYNNNMDYTYDTIIGGEGYSYAPINGIMRSVSKPSEYGGDNESWYNLHAQKEYSATHICFPNDALDCTKLLAPAHNQWIGVSDDCTIVIAYLITSINQYLGADSLYTVMGKHRDDALSPNGTNIYYLPQ